MSKTFEQGRKEVVTLCKYFATNYRAFTMPGIKEAHVRQSLIDPLFEALGWNVRNNPPVAPHLREVIPEDSLEVEGSQRAPDYTFRVGTTPRFLVEAKKCGVNLESDQNSAYQLRRYGWNAKVPLSILTDFEELAVYDCTLRPRPTDKASHARILYFRFEEYDDRWRELWDIFSREAMWSGAFDQYAASKRKRGTSEVDVEFLKEIEAWRESLARNIALRNTDISSDDLNAAVQLTIDRVVFLRMAEDRGLEPYEQLLRLCEQPEMYARFMRHLCRRADEKYNSGLFHFDKESGVSDPPDRITPKLAIDDKVFKPLIQSLYFAYGSPYDFRVLPVEILGTVYERFLGKVIRLTSGHQAKIEDKPEVRKAGGVYYTPAHIVDYIVGETVGRQVRGKSPSQLAGGKGKRPLRVLDIACGSGSFLLGAYQCLLNHCLMWYSDHEPKSYKRAVYQDPRTGAWTLTIEEKKRILTTHLFGVDIDPQAVEVTKLSLLLKALEGENDATLSLQQRLFHDRALPNLAQNIKCGNSLIGPDYFVGKPLPEPDELRRINPLNWNTAFPEAMQAGGFDCVIGNPPYIRIQTMKEWAPLDVEIFKALFLASGAGNYDIYVVFIEQGLKLLNANGQLGFICPHKFFNAQYGAPLRELLSHGRHLAHIVHFGAQQVFSGATTYTCLLFLDKAGRRKCRFVSVPDLTAWIKSGAALRGDLVAEKINGDVWNFTVGDGAELVQRLRDMPVKLGDLADIFVGLQTSADDIFILESVEETARTLRLRSKSLDQTWTFEKSLLHPLASGTDVRAYSPLPRRQYILFPYVVEHEKASLIDFTTLQREYPKTAAYLLENKQRLEEREKGRFRGPTWYRFGRSQNLGIQARVKLCVPRLVETLHAAYDVDGSHFLDNVDVGGVTLKPTHTSCDLRYLLALLNSRLLAWFFPHVSAPFRGGWMSANRQFLSQLPIRMIDFSAPADRSRPDRLLDLVEQMLTLHRQAAEVRTAQTSAALSRQIAATRAQIDRLVYDLYGLSEDEVSIVEGATTEVTK